MTFLAKIVAWITAGYPRVCRAPIECRFSLFSGAASSDDEVKAVTRELKDLGEFDSADIGVLITQITDELPTPEDIERVRARLATKGWPLDDPRDPEEAHSRPAPRRRAVRSFGTVGAARGGGRARGTHDGVTGADGRPTRNLLANNVIARRLRHR